MPPPPSFSIIRYWLRVSPIIAGFRCGILSVDAGQSQRIGVSDRGRGARGGVAAEDAEFAGDVSDFREGLVEPGDISGFEIDKELIFPRAAVDGAAFNFEQTCRVFQDRKSTRLN